MFRAVLKKLLNDDSGDSTRIAEVAHAASRSPPSYRALRLGAPPKRAPARADRSRPPLPWRPSRWVAGRSLLSNETRHRCCWRHSGGLPVQRPHYREVDYQPDVPGRAHYQKPVCPFHHLGTACAPKKDSAPLPPIQTTAPSLTTHLQGGESDPGQVVSQEYKD